MKLFKVRCPSCQHEFETDREQAVCPACGTAFPAASEAIKEDDQSGRAMRIGILGAAVLLTAFLLTCFVIQFLPKPRPEPASVSETEIPEEAITINVQALTEEIQKQQKLITASQQYQYTETFEDHKEAFGIKVPFSTRKLTVGYIGTVEAGIDCSEVTIESDEENRIIYVTLPASTVMHNSFDPNSFTVYDEQDSILNRIEAEDIDRLQKLMVEKGLQQALADGILETADANAAETITSLLRSMSITDDYEIICRFLPRQELPY